VNDIVKEPALIAFALLFLASGALSQSAPPATDVYRVEVTWTDAGPRVGAPENLTDREGYDNQPQFLPGGSGLVYTSIREGQADAYRYDFASGEHRPVTQTPESEYSPTPIPGEAAISVVRVEADGRQRLWGFSLDGSKGELLLPNVEPVGYHVWADARNLALFVLGEPPTLERAERGPGSSKEVAKGIGRGLGKVPGERAVVFVRSSEESTQLVRHDFETGELEPLLEARPGSEDFAFDPEGGIWMAEGTKIYRATAETWEWRLVADFDDAGLGEITRLAFDGEGARLALVAARAQSSSQSQK